MRVGTRLVLSNTVMAVVMRMAMSSVAMTVSAVHWFALNVKIYPLG